MLGMAKIKFGEMSNIDLEEAMARDYQVFKIPLLKRFISVTAKHLNSLEAMYVAMDRANFQTEYNKFFGQRNALKVEKDFRSIQNFRAAEEEFFDRFHSLVDNKDFNSPVYSFEEALDEVFNLVDLEIDYWKQELPNAATPEYIAEVTNSITVLSLIQKNKSALVDHFFYGYDKSRIKAKEKLKVGQFKLMSVLGNTDSTEEERTLAEEKFNTLRQEVEDSLTVDPQTALSARVKYRLAGLTYQSSKRDKTPIPFHKSFSILIKYLNQANTSSVQSLISHIEKAASNFVTARETPQSPQEAVVRMMQNLVTELKLKSPKYTFRRDITHKSLYVLGEDGLAIGQQNEGESLDDFINRIAPNDRENIVKSYKHFEAFTTAASLSSAICAQRPFKM